MCWRIHSAPTIRESKSRHAALTFSPRASGNRSHTGKVPPFQGSGEARKWGFILRPTGGFRRPAIDGRPSGGQTRGRWSAPPSVETDVGTYPVFGSSIDSSNLSRRAVVPSWFYCRLSSIGTTTSLPQHNDPFLVVRQSLLPRLCVSPTPLRARRRCARGTRVCRSRSNFFPGPRFDESRATLRKSPVEMWPGVRLG